MIDLRNAIDRLANDSQRAKDDFESLLARRKDRPQNDRGNAGNEGGKPQTGDPMPVEPDGGIGDGAGPIPDATTLAIGEEDGGGGTPPDAGGGPDVTTLAIGEEDGGGDTGGGGIEGGNDDPILTTLAIGEEDGGPSFEFGTDGDDRLSGTRENDRIFTGQGNDSVRARNGDDRIVVDGVGDKNIDGGRGNDTVELKGSSSDYAIDASGKRFTYTSPDGSRITVRNVENVFFSGSGETLPVGETGTVPPVDPGPGVPLTTFNLAPNDLGATKIVVEGDTATLLGPDTNFVFTGLDDRRPVDGPLTASAGSGTINGVETTAVPISGDTGAVLSIGSGFNITRTQQVDAAFANGDTLDTTVDNGF